jgi:hypothetical protein
LDMEPVPIFSIGWMTFCVWREALYLFANSWKQIVSIPSLVLFRWRTLQGMLFAVFFAASVKCHYLFNLVRISSGMYIKSKYDLSGHMQLYIALHSYATI